MTVLNKLMIFGVSYGHLLFNKLKRLVNKENGQGILVVEQGVLGDTLIFLDALMQMKTYYSKSNQELTIACRKELYFLYELLGFKADDIKTIKMNNPFWPSLKEFMCLANSIRYKKFKKVYVVMHHGWGHLLAALVNADEYFCFSNREWLTSRTKAIEIIVDNLYTDIFCPSTIEFMGESYKKYLQYIGIENYKSKMISFDIEEDNFRKLYSEYIVFAPIGNNKERTLSAEQIKTVIQILLENTKYKIILTAIKRENDNYLNGIKDFRDENRVIDYAGKTKLNDFVRLINGSKMVIGVDSGHIHLAAALKIPSISFCGKWEPKEFLPYDFDCKEKYYPKCIYSQKDYICEGCQIKLGRKSKYMKPNSECQNRIRNGQNRLCLNDIDLYELEKLLKILELENGI